MRCENGEEEFDCNAFVWYTYVWRTMYKCYGCSPLDIYSRMKSDATPMPVLDANVSKYSKPKIEIPYLAHMLTMPISLSCLCSSASRVATCLAPVAPTGWPRAIAPPLGLTLSISRPNSRRQ